MRFMLLSVLFSFLLISCGTARRINYSFQEPAVSDSIIYRLKESERIYQKPYQKIMWFALLREATGGFELIINARFGDKKNPLNILLRKTNRFLKIKNLMIPVLFESDILSLEMIKENVASINWGGCYFKIEKRNYVYQVIKTAVLF